MWVAREVIAPYLMNKLEGKFIAAELVSQFGPARRGDGRRCAIQRRDSVPGGTLTNYYFGHIGALTMHPTFVLPPEWDDSVMREINEHQFRKEADFNIKYGTCGGEWGQFSPRGRHSSSGATERRATNSSRTLKPYSTPTTSLIPAYWKGIDSLSVYFWECIRREEGEPWAPRISPKPLAILFAVPHSMTPA